MHDEQIPCHNHFHEHDDLPHDHPFRHIRDCSVECCQDQLPLEAAIGRGPKGEGFFVRLIDPDDCTQTYLEGLSIDPTDGSVKSEWISDNINGGELSYQYNLRPYTLPPTFTITFIYRRPSGQNAMERWDGHKVVDVSKTGNNPEGKKPTNPRHECIGSSPEYGKQIGVPDMCSWSWTTPAIPYCWDVDGDGEPEADHVVGSGVGSLFLRTDSVDHQEQIGNKGNPVDNMWVEKLVYPDGTGPSDYNAPRPLEAWSVNLTFGLLHGDVLVPNLYDLADMLGFGAGNIYNSVDGQSGQYSGGLFTGSYDDLKHYIDGNDKALLDHFHKDLGFDPSTLPDETGDHGTSEDKYNAKDYTDWWVNFILNRIVQPESNIRIKFSDAQALQMFNRPNNKTQNNWSEPHLGGEIFISPSAGLMFIHFAYNTAINNGLRDEDGNKKVSPDPTVWNPADALPDGAIIDLNLLPELDVRRLHQFMPENYAQSGLSSNPAVMDKAGLVFVTAGGAQPYIGGAQVGNEVQLEVTHEGFIRVNNAIAFSPYIYQELLHGGEPSIYEWEITISGTIMASLDKSWNSDMPWYTEKPGYADPFGHPSKPPQEMFKDIFELGTKH